MNNFLEQLEKHFKNTSKEEIKENWAKTKEFDNVGPTVSEYLKQLNEMTKIDVHSGTTKQEIINYVNNNKGQILTLHYEGNTYTNWGDDYMYNFDTNIENEYNNLITTINNHDIHNIFISKGPTFDELINKK